jgi:hypothetical protein
MENDLNRPAVRRIALVMILAIAFGLIIAKIDTSPNWDDTGVSMFLLFSASAICGFLVPQYPWLIALSVCLWIPLYNIISSGNYGSLLAIVPGFAGAYTGFYGRKFIAGPRRD